MLIYVYDIFLTGNNHRSMNLFVTKLNDLFSLKDLGPVHYFLGIEISRDSTGFYLNQRKYINDLLDRWSIFHVSPCLHYANGPGSISFKMDSAPYTNPVSYRRIVGALHSSIWQTQGQTLHFLSVNSVNSLRHQQNYNGKQSKIYFGISKGQLI